MIASGSRPAELRARARGRGSSSPRCGRARAASRDRSRPTLRPRRGRPCRSRRCGRRAARGSAPNSSIWRRIDAAAWCRARRPAPSTPARAPYAAAATPAFPAVGRVKRSTPAARARVIAALSPRDLNDPVGLAPSSLTRSSGIPARRRAAAVCRSGVSPSPSVTGCSPAESGRKEPVAPHAVRGGAARRAR